MTEARSRERFPALLRLTARAINAALGVWVTEALFVILDLVLMGRGGAAGGMAARAFAAASPWLLVAQGAAAFMILACLLIRHALHAEPLAPFEHVWLAFLLTLVLFGSTLYILLVGARDFATNRIFVSRVETTVGIQKDPEDPKNPFQRKLLVNEDPITVDQVLQAFREASAELAIAVSLGTGSALGLLVLHFMGWVDRRGS